MFKKMEKVVSEKQTILQPHRIFSYTVKQQLKKKIVNHFKTALLLTFFLNLNTLSILWIKFHFKIHFKFVHK